MKALRTLVVLTVINVAALVFTIAVHLQPVFAAGPPSVLRGSGLEIVDAQNRVRASISILPPAATPGDEAPAETVLLRLITERGRPSIKIGSSEPGSGISIAGPTGTKDTYVILQAKGAVSSLKLRNESGGEKIVEP